jgi:NAD-dependent SIR2 family protein deacetylase
MSKLGLFASILSIAGVFTFATLTASADDAPAPAAAGACVHTDFKTELVKQACTKGGQKAAKDAMKAFMKEKKIKSCNQCHSKLAPKYELKPDGLEQFQKIGGK